MSDLKILGAVDNSELFADTITETAEPVEVPEVKTEVVESKEEVKPEVKAEEKIETTVETQPEIKVESKPAEPDWREVLKKADRRDALKELGLDEFEINLLDYRKTTGDLTPYLEAKTKDWDKMTEVAVLRDELKRQHPSLSEEDFDLLADKRINQKFLLDTELHDEKEVRLAKIELKSEAEAIRQKRKEEQLKFTAPERKPDDTAQKQQEANEKAIAEYVESVKNDPVTRKLLSEQKLVLGENYNYKVNATDLVSIAEDPQKFWGLFSDGKETNWENFYATVAYAKDRKQIEKNLIEYGKSLALKESAEELENTSKEEPAKAAPKKESLGQAFASRGTPYSFT